MAHPARHDCPECDRSANPRERYPDHAAELLRLRRVRGQIEGIENMIAQGRYCADILIQMRAAKAALEKVEEGVLARHLRGCVREALQSKNKLKAETKIRELLDLLAANR